MIRRARRFTIDGPIPATGRRRPFPWLVVLVVGAGLALIGLIAAGLVNTLAVAPSAVLLAAAGAAAWIDWADR